MRYRRGLAALAVFATVLAACSSGGKSTTTTTPPSSSTVATPTTPATSPSTTSPATTTTESPYGSATLLTSIIQKELTTLGHFKGSPDGILGPATEEAIAAFQKEAGITADGQYGPETYRALADALEGNADFVESLQKDLKELKLYRGPADGDYGSGTVKAVKALQEECDLDADGRFTPKTHVCLEQKRGRA